MTRVSVENQFKQWYSALLTLADQDGCRWLVVSDPRYHRPSFDFGLTPDEELERLKLAGGSGNCGCSA